MSPSYSDHAAGSKDWSNRNFPIVWQLVRSMLPISEYAHKRLWSLWIDFKDSVSLGMEMLTFLLLSC